jgi:RNA polymerase sigma-70 factor (ECF subfamily)
LDLPEPVSPDADEPPSSIVCSEELQQLSCAMTQLAYDQREAIMLHFQAAMTFRTIATQQGISVNTVKSRYRYGLDKLRSILDSESKK